MSEKLDKLRADLARARERRIQLNNRIELLERRIAEAEKVEVAEMVRVANLTPEQLAALLQQNAHTTPNPAALAARRGQHERGGTAVRKFLNKLTCIALSLTFLMGCMSTPAFAYSGGESSEETTAPSIFETEEEPVTVTEQDTAL